MAALNGPGGVAGAVQNVQGRIVGLTAAAEIAARTGMGRLRTAMSDIAAAANGPGGLAAGAQVAAGKVGGLAKSAGNAAAAIGGKLMTGLSSVSTFLGGPWGVALAGATIAVGVLANASADYNGKISTLKNTLDELGTEYKDLQKAGQLSSPEASSLLLQIAQSNPEMQKAVVNLNSVGIALGDLGRAAAGSKQDLEHILDVLDKEIDEAEKKWQDESNFLFTVWSKDARQASDRLEQLRQLREAVKQHADEVGRASEVEQLFNTQSERSVAMGKIVQNTTGATTGQLAQMAMAWDLNQIKIDDLNKTLGNFGEDAAAAARRADDLTAAIKRQYGAAIDANEASERWNSTLVTLRESVAANGRTLDVNSRAGLANRDALEAAAQSSRELFIEEVRQGGKLPEVTAKHQDRINKLKEEAVKTFGAKSEAVKLIDTYGKIDPKITTKYSTQNFDTVFKQAQQLQFAQTMLELGITDPKEAAARWKRQQAIISGNYPTGSGGTSRKATGGEIGGQGTGTSDNQLIWASPGEHMLTAAEVQVAGGQEAIYAWRRTLMANRRMPGVEELPAHAVGGEVRRRPPVPQQRAPWDLPGYAKGGAIAPFIVDFSGTKLPTREQALSKVQVAGDGSFTSLSPDASVAKLQKWALAQRGKTYLWAATGPRHYDCSGLVGNLFALATGRPLYRRYMSTSDMGPGRHGMVSGPGKKMTIYLGPGHTAANVGGLHVEAYGGNGTPLAVGRIGTRLSYYNQRLHLPGFAEGGAIDAGQLHTKRDRMLSFLKYGWPEPPGGTTFDELLGSNLASNQYDIGGMLPPGYSTVYNGTGAPEPVLTSQQWRDISSLAEAAAGRAGNNYYYEFRDTTLTPAYLRGLQDREAVLARDGRAR